MRSTKSLCFFSVSLSFFDPKLILRSVQNTTGDAVSMLRTTSQRFENQQVQRSLESFTWHKAEYQDVWEKYAAGRVSASTSKSQMSKIASVFDIRRPYATGSTRTQICKFARLRKLNGNGLRKRSAYPIDQPPGSTLKARTLAGYSRTQAASRRGISRPKPRL